MSTTEVTDRPLRADAARNRAKVLEAARRTFAAQGLDAEMAVLAAEAGVGVGTLYRHFPNKDALLAALTATHFGRLADIAADVLAEDISPWDRVERLVWRAAELTADDSGMCDILAAAPVKVAETPEAQLLRKLTAEIVDSAREAGAARADARGDDVPMMMCGFGKVASNQRSGAPFDWQRYLRIMLDGLRAPG